MTHTKLCIIVFINYKNKTINQPYDDTKMSYNNEFQITHKSIIHNLTPITWVIEIKKTNNLISNNFKILTF